MKHFNNQMPSNMCFMTRKKQLKRQPEKVFINSNKKDSYNNSKRKLKSKRINISCQSQLSSLSDYKFNRYLKFNLKI